LLLNDFLEVDGVGHERGGSSTGILRHKALSPTIPERGFCGEPVEGAVIPLRPEENSNHRAGMKFDAGVGFFDSACPAINAGHAALRMTE
jgi:hypothetical protein